MRLNGTVIRHNLELYLYHQVKPWKNYVVYTQFYNWLNPSNYTLLSNVAKDVLNDKAR